mgnify:CR=1 FL=1
MSSPTVTKKNTKPVLFGLTKTRTSQYKEYFSYPMTETKVRTFNTSPYSHENVNKQLSKHKYDGPYKTK